MISMNNAPTTTRTTRTTRYPDRWASDGAVNQEGSLPLYRCNGCKAEVVWVTSNRTGRKYLASVFQSRSGARFYIKRAPHTCSAPQPA